MTQQFKFGDLVLWGINPSPFVFMGVSKIDPDLAWIRADNDLPHHAPFDELKPVPHTKPIRHPDTVRLDWLEKNHAILYHNIAEDIKHGCAPVEVRCLHEEKPHGGCTAREAIDTAMREKAA